MTKYKGRGAVTTTGHSTYSAQAFNRLFQDVFSQPLEKLICDAGTIYGKRYYTVEPIGGDWLAMEEWCLKQFGEEASIFDDALLGRWYMNNRKIWFRDEQDQMFFVLKWS
jgi:hypothetical protein